MKKPANIPVKSLDKSLIKRKVSLQNLGLTKSELKIFKKLNTPIKIQAFLDTLAFNFEEDGDFNMSPRQVLTNKKAHCFEAAMFAALALKIHGHKPLIIDLKTEGDIGHVLAIYQVNGLWGAISKTNHIVLRFRDPVYKNIRELVMSYFHEYFNEKSFKKVLRSYSGPFNIDRWGTKWITTEEDLYYIAEEVFDAKQNILVPKSQIKYCRKADSMERFGGQFTEWKKKS